MMRGVILVAGKGSRLFPITKGIPKALLPVYDRPMIYFALEFMCRCGIKEVFIVISKEYESLYKNALSDLEEFDLNITYGYQTQINGTAGALRVAEDFMKGYDTVVYFGDNVLLNVDVDTIVKEAIENLDENLESMVITEVENPSSFGVIEIDENKNVTSFEEKPQFPKTNLISTGIYFFPKDVVTKMIEIPLSERGEYEMTDVHKKYLRERRLKAIALNKNALWYDAGNFDELLKANIAMRVQRIKEKQRE